MLDYGKVTDTIYKRSVRKVIERNVPGAGDDRIGGRDILYFAADSDKAMLTAFATLTGNQLAAAGAVHLAVNRLAAAGAYALAVNIQLIVSAELPEKSIKALMGSVSESCGKLHITSVQADVAALLGRWFRRRDRWCGRNGVDFHPLCRFFCLVNALTGFIKSLDTVFCTRAGLLQKFSG